MKIAITGGTGFLGRHLTSYLETLHHEIILIRRSDLNEGVERISKLIKSSDVLINLAGSPVIKRWTAKNKSEILQSRVATTIRLMEAIRGLDIGERPQLLISASAIGIYKADLEHTEKSVELEDNFLAEVCRKWEGALQSAEELKIRTCILRIGIVLARDGGIIQQMLPLFRLGLGGKIGSGKQPFSFIHIMDFCRAIQFIMENHKCSGIYNLTAPKVGTNAEFTTLLGTKLHRPTILTVPEFALRLIFGAAAVAMIKGQKVYPQHLLSDGFHFDYPDLRSNIHQILG